uniref:3'-5' exonuclease domain-containing protein n=1 Tax=viral metagenome TaxID=1070528 RepID=A0A6C0C8G1_9ZZZZ
MSNNIVTPFHKIYDEIVTEYEKNNTDVEKWNIISAKINENNNVFVQMFQFLKKQKLEKLTYVAKLEKISSSNEMELIRSIISRLHFIIYNLCSKEGNYYFALNGQDEMIVLQKPLTYYISISKKNEQNVFFHAFMLLYALESLFYTTFYVGIDFEYTHHKIKLAQINFEHKSDDRSIIMIIGPTELEKVMLENFINMIMRNNHCKKILHGSDSLDYPYIRDEMLDKDESRIIEFTNSMVDTRFICEYYKLSRDEASDNKCSLYDAFVYFGVITQEKLDQFNTMVENMGHPNDRVWDIHNLSKAQELYVQYDVLFLKYFYFKMISMATNDGKTSADKKKILDLYKHVIYELTQFIYLENSLITTLLVQCKEEVDPCNNYMIRRPHGTFKLIDIFNSVTKGIKTADVDVDMLSKVKAFSRVITLLLKKLTYTIISQKYTVQKTKTVMWNEKLDNDYVYDFFDEMPYLYLKKLFKDVERILITRINDFAK